MQNINLFSQLFPGEYGFPCPAVGYPDGSLPKVFLLVSIALGLFGLLSIIAFRAKLRKTKAILSAIIFFGTFLYFANNFKPDCGPSVLQTNRGMLASVLILTISIISFVPVMGVIYRKLKKQSRKTKELIILSIITAFILASAVYFANL